MAIPDYHSVMLPLLRYAADGQEHSAREAIEDLADQFHLTDEERKELLRGRGLRAVRMPVPSGPLPGEAPDQKEDGP